MSPAESQFQLEQLKCHLRLKHYKCGLECYELEAVEISGSVIAESVRVSNLSRNPCELLNCHF